MKDLEGLQKAMAGLGTHFGKASAHHMALHKCHSAMAKAHEGHATMCKAKADALDEGHVDKAYFGAAHEMHKAMAGHNAEVADHHKAQADHCTACQASMDGAAAEKAAGAAPAVATATAPKYISMGKNAEGVELFKLDDSAAPAPAAAAATGSVDEMIETTKKALVAKGLASMTDDPDVAKQIKEIVLKAVSQALGDKIVPTNVHGVMPLDMPSGPTIVQRPGGAPIDTSKVPAEFAELVEV